MFCMHCGKEIPDRAQFCSGCGQSQEPAPQSDPAPASKPAAQPAEPGSDLKVEPKSDLVGWSERINDPAFARYLKNSGRWAWIFAFILFAAAVIGFPIYGQKSGELEFSQSIVYGLIIGGMFVVIAFFTNLSRSRDTTWDGVVVDKKVSKKKRSDEDSTTTYLVYETKVKRDKGGKTKTMRQENTDKIYNYYQIGDKVRHHKGFGIYEKYDKSRDSHLFCIACGKQVEVDVDTCKRCKCPILK